MCGHACAMENVWKPAGNKASHFSVFIMWVSRLNWGCQTWQQVPSHTEASCWLRGSCPPVLLIHANITDNFWTFPEDFHHHHPLHSSSFSPLCVCVMYMWCVCVLFMMCMCVLFVICMCVSCVYCLSLWYIICMCGTSAMYVPCVSCYLFVICVYCLCIWYIRVMRVMSLITACNSCVLFVCDISVWCMFCVCDECDTCVLFMCVICVHASVHCLLCDLGLCFVCLRTCVMWYVCACVQCICVMCAICYVCDMYLLCAVYVCDVSVLRIHVCFVCDVCCLCVWCACVFCLCDWYVWKRVHAHACVLFWQWFLPERGFYLSHHFNFTYFETTKMFSPSALFQFSLFYCSLSLTVLPRKDKIIA